MIEKVPNLKKLKKLSKSKENIHLTEIKETPTKSELPSNDIKKFQIPLIRPTKCSSAQPKETKIIDENERIQLKKTLTQIDLKRDFLVNNNDLAADKLLEIKFLDLNILNHDPNNNNNKNNNNNNNNKETLIIDNEKSIEIPEVLRKQGTASNCSSNVENTCPCNTIDANSMQQVIVSTKQQQINFCNRKSWISVERMTELRKKAQEALKLNKTFTIRGCFFSVRNALTARGWVEKLDMHRKNVPNGVCQVTYEDITQALPKRRPGETRRQYVNKCERNIMSRFLEHMPINFLWTARKEKCDYTDQAKNPSMTINKFARIPFTSKEGLCNQLKDFHWYYEEGTSELYFPRCFNVWSPEELSDFIDNFRITACICFLKWLVDKYHEYNFDGCFSTNGKIPFTSIEFAIKRCNEYLDMCLHNDIDIDIVEQTKIWEHDWDAFLTHHFIMTHENAKILTEHNRMLDTTIRNAENILELMIAYWPQYNLDGYFNLWIIKPANKCRGRGIQLIDNLKKIMNLVNPAITSKSRYVVQKYIERPLIIHNTKFDIRQWFMITNVQPMVIWMYKESYLRFSSQEFNLTSHHESVHLTNHAIQKKYRNNGKRDKRLPNENMWDCYSFQAYLRQIGEHKKWSERIYPGMCQAIIGTMLASQEQMDRRTNTFELFGADFMISEDFYPWLIEINSSPDLGATTSVTARMCPQCLEDAIKVVIDKRIDSKADTGNFEMIYRQIMPPTPAYMGLNLFLKGKQILPKNHGNHHQNHNYNHHHHQHRIRSERSVTSISMQRQLMPTINFQCSSIVNNATGGSVGVGVNNSQSQICSMFSFGDKSTNCESKEFDNNQMTLQLDGTTNPHHQFRKSSIISLNSNQFIRQPAALDTVQYFQQPARLLTPIIPPSILSRNGGGSQLMLSPRGTLIGDRRRSTENSNNNNSWKNDSMNKNKPKILSTQFGSLARRHFSCVPRITTRYTTQSTTLIKNNENIAEDNQHIQPNDTELSSVIITAPNQNSTTTTTTATATATTTTKVTNASPMSISNGTSNPTIECRKKMFEILYKSKTACKVNRLTKSPNVKSSKSPPISSSLNCSNATIVSYRKSCLLNKKNLNVSCGGGEYRRINLEKNNSGVYNKEKLSLRAWRSKQLEKDGTVSISGRSKNNGICKSAPISNLSPNKKRNVGASDIISSRQLCKNSNKKNC